MTKLHIGVDLDNVVADFQSHWAKVYETWFGRSVPADALDEWDGIVLGTHFANEGEFWAWVASVPGFWETMPPVPGALGGLYLLHNAGHRISFITSRHESARHATKDWVWCHFPSTSTPPVIHHVGASLKGTIDVQAYIDDDPRALRALAAEGKPLVIRYKRPWNKGEPGLGVDTWADVVALIERVSAGEDLDLDPEPEVEP